MQGARGPATNDLGVKVREAACLPFGGVHVADQCSCSRERIRGILQGFSAEEIRQSTEDGRIEVACEFCSTAHAFDPVEFLQA